MIGCLPGRFHGLRARWWGGILRRPHRLHGLCRFRGTRCFQHLYIALHYNTLRYTALHYYITLHCITLHYITLHTKRT